jgi:hypothetical protein
MGLVPERGVMLYVGRERETRQMHRALEEGSNVVVMGKYGIGRTSLVQHLAEEYGERWQFVFLDGERSAADICRDLFVALFPDSTPGPRGGSLPYRWARFRIFNREPELRKPPVATLDDVGAISNQKLSLLGELARRVKLRWIVVVESFLEPGVRERLRARLTPVRTVRLGYLSRESTRLYFQLSSEAYQLGWTATEIESLAQATGGYPLAMQEAVSTALGRRNGRRAH